MIDDNVPFREALAKIIDCRWPLVTIQGASDSIDGLARLKSFLPDLVFVDIHLPGESGLDLSRKIKYVSPDTIIIAFTSYDLPEYRNAMQESGIDHFIPKDAWTGEEMLTLVASVLYPEE